MDAFLIQGPARLRGSVRISGSKNSALPLLFGSLLFDTEVRYENVPRLWDIETTLKLLQSMGADTQWNKEAGTISIFPRVQHKIAPYEWVRQMRAGILALGPLVAKYGEAKVSLPGGCAIGARPVNYHLEALKQMGVSVDVEGGYVKAQCLGRLQGANIRFPEVTVTGTENLLYVATQAEGTTVLENAAREPEVVALGEWLKTCGAEISGLGTSSIQIKGGKKLAITRVVHIPPDRIETGTWISIAAATRSELKICDAEFSQLGAVVSAYEQMGVKFRMDKDQRAATVIPADTYQPIELVTQPYPGFPTDMQAQILANSLLANGVSRIDETIFENRFMHVAELRRLGAQIEVEGNTAIVRGPAELKAAPMMATDLRASASLVVAALAAKGESRISRIYHLDRGYERLDKKLTSLGATVRRVSE